MKDKITVFGSFVVDLMSRAPHLPVPGETVKGSLFMMGPGGKGFNQGVAAHKAGATVSMITKLGRDKFADVAIDAMNELGMDTELVFFSEDSSTGTALILVDDTTSQNSILVVSGACDTFSDEDIRKMAPTIKESKYLLTQLETNLDAVEKVVDLAYESGVKVILNPAPVQIVPDSLLNKMYLVTPNEVEAEILTGVAVKDEETANKAASIFFDKGVENVIITLGEKGVYVNTKDRQEIIPAYRVKAVDTTGAGDAFNGGLVTGLAEGKTIWEAAKFANALAAVSVQRLGTTPAMPIREEIDSFLKEVGEC